MIRNFTSTLMAVLLISSTVFAKKPYEEWNREDVMAYFENNNIVFEGEYKDEIGGQYILIGKLNSQTEEVNLNFFLSNGKLEKASLTTSQKDTYLTLNEIVEEEGFHKISESNDRLGNHYSRYQSGEVELTLVRKTADWPAVYFQP